MEWPLLTIFIIIIYLTFGGERYLEQYVALCYGASPHLLFAQKWQNHYSIFFSSVPVADSAHSLILFFVLSQLWTMRTTQRRRQHWEWTQRQSCWSRRGQQAMRVLASAMRSQKTRRKTACLSATLTVMQVQRRKNCLKEKSLLWKVDWFKDLWTLWDSTSL